MLLTNWTVAYERLGHAKPVRTNPCGSGSPDICFSSLFFTQIAVSGQCVCDSNQGSSAGELNPSPPVPALFPQSNSHPPWRRGRLEFGFGEATYRGMRVCVGDPKTGLPRPCDQAPSWGSPIANPWRGSVIDLRHHSGFEPKALRFRQSLFIIYQTWAAMLDAFTSEYIPLNTVGFTSE